MTSQLSECFGKESSLLHLFDKFPSLEWNMSIPGGHNSRRLINRHWRSLPASHSHPGSPLLPGSTDKPCFPPSSAVRYGHGAVKCGQKRRMPLPGPAHESLPCVLLCACPLPAVHLEVLENGTASVGPGPTWLHGRGPPFWLVHLPSSITWAWKILLLCLSHNIFWGLFLWRSAYPT